MCEGHIAYNVGQAKGFKGEKDVCVLVGGLGGRSGEVCRVGAASSFAMDATSLQMWLTFSSPSPRHARPVPTRLHVWVSPAWFVCAGHVTLLSSSQFAMPTFSLYCVLFHASRELVR
eukprot:710460-Rhodomonas_salina.1